MGTDADLMIGFDSNTFADKMWEPRTAPVFFSEYEYDNDYDFDYKENNYDFDDCDYVFYE